jgi:putative transposase
MKYAFIEQEREHYPVVHLCRWLEVSASGYYAWRHRPPSAREQANHAVQAQLVAFFEQSRRTYGSPRLTVALRQAGIVCNRKRVMRLMRRAGLVAKGHSKRIRTTVADERDPVAPYRLDRNFTAAAPNQKWVADITFIATHEGWLYLAVVLDLFARRVVGWAMDSQMQVELVERALTMARQHRLPPPNLLFHSDRGSQYTAHAFQQQLSAAQMVASMSRRANCWDNAPMESFFGTLKTECADHLFASRAEARCQIFDYLETWYNPLRLHSTNGYLSPAAKEQAFYQTPNHDHNGNDPFKGGTAQPPY